jgi:hypothetical protein
MIYGRPISVEVIRRTQNSDTDGIKDSVFLHDLHLGPSAMNRVYNKKTPAVALM